MNTILPIYYQIRETIKGWIIDKEFNFGEKIPSENELAEKFGVSRLTVRQGIAKLVQEGFLISKRGEGTFVTHNQSLINGFSLKFTGFMDDLLYQISRSKTKSVKMKRIPVPKLIKEKLELGKEEKEVIQIKRVRFLEDKVFAFTVNYLSLEIGGKIHKQDLYKKPLLQIMEEDLGIKFTGAFQTIEASFADQELVDELGVVLGSPILFVERIMYTKKSKPVELVQTSYRGDLYKYIVRLEKVKRRKGSVWVHQAQSVYERFYGKGGDLEKGK